MRHRIAPKVFFSVTLLALISALTPALADEPPSIRAYANAPGWITVIWEHPGTDVFWFEIHRQDAPYTDASTYLIVRSNNRTDSVTDKNLKADTLYKYRACAVYAYSRSCSDWVSVKTMPPPPPPSDGTAQNAPPKHQLRTPNLTATSNAPNFITLHWGSDSSDLYTLGNVQLYRDGQITYDSKKYGGFVADYNDGGKMYDSATKQWTGQPLRPNTEYSYKVCFIGFNEANGQTVCSREIVAIGQPITPTMPGNVTISKSRIPVPTSKTLAAALVFRTVVFANWRSPDPTKGEIPGQFITLERQDRVISGNKNRISAAMFVNAWIEIDRIKAKGDPTSLSMDITPAGLRDPTDTPGNNYRLCAVVPALGAGGKMCSAPVTLP